MSKTGPAHFRDRLARAALMTFAVSAVAFVWLTVAMLSSPDFATDFENGTHLYKGGEPIPCLGVVAAISLVAGCFGTGRAATCCQVIVGVGIFLLVVIAVR